MAALDFMNLLVLRLASKETHTWRADDSALMLQSLPVHECVDKELVNNTAYLAYLNPGEGIEHSAAKLFITV